MHMFPIMPLHFEKTDESILISKKNTLKSTRVFCYTKIYTAARNLRKRISASLSICFQYSASFMSVK